MPAGPILIFDKSALQALSLDESNWLDNFFMTNVTPLFFAETLVGRRPLVWMRMQL